MGWCLFAVAQAQSISGRVIDASTGNPLEGATVRIKGTTTGILTDARGEFRLQIPGEAEALLISFIGMVPQEVPINGQTIFSISLQPDEVSLEEVVVTGYSTQSRSKVISSVAVVSKENIENVPLPDVNQIIQGRAPGVLSTSGWGQPGAAQTIRVRGTGSISAGRGPLYVIDGIIVNSGDFTTNTFSNDILSNLNPNDIASVNVLKDATATALYGARAANGVIVITTKRGSEGKTQISLKTQVGVTQPNFGTFEMMNASEALRYEREILEASGFEPNEIDDIRPASLANVNTDWVDLAFQNGTTQMYELSASGGSARTSFYISGSYFDQEGTLMESGFKRYSALSNLVHKATEKLDFAIKVNVSYTNQLNATSGARFSSPILGAFSNSPWTRYRDPVTGDLLVGDESEDIINFEPFVGDNFVRSVPLNPVENFNLRTLGNFTVGYQILKGLRFEETVSIDFISIKEKDFFDPSTPDGAFTSPPGSVTNAYNENIAYTNQTLLKGNHTFGQAHNLDGVIGFEYQKSELANFSALGFGVPSPKLKNLGTTTLPIFVGGSGTEYSFVSYLGQLNYNFNNRYYMTTSYRRDGSSRFGADNRWADFYSVGASWRITEEPFMANISFLSNLKLRASFGTSGNAEIGNFSSLELYSFGGNYNGFAASGPTQVPNPDLRWEKSEIANIGLDFGLFNDRITGTVEVYNRDSKDLLLSKPLSATSGFTSALQNVGKLTNKGLEAQASIDVIRSPFVWTMDFNITFNRNEIVELVDTSDINNGLQILRVGHPIRSWYMRRWAGANPADGTPLWADGEGGVTGTYDDAPREIVGNAEPDFYGGWTHSFSYKGLTFSAFFYFVQGNEIYDGSRFYIDSDGQRFGWGHPRFVADRWQQPGDISDRPEALVGGNNNANLNSTRYLSDGSFVRLRNLLLAYSLPTPVVQKFKLSGLRIYLQGQNIWTLTDYSGFDPELAENGQEFFRYPNGKSYTLGLDVNF